MRRFSTISSAAMLAQIAIEPILKTLAPEERILLLNHLYREAVYEPIGNESGMDPQEFTCFDNGGKTADRYTVYPFHEDNACANDCLGLDGVGGTVFAQWTTGNRAGMLKESPDADNFVVDWASLPAATIIHVRRRLA